MEVILSLIRVGSMIVSFLHVCGGDPVLKPRFEFEKRFSPRMWRWSYSQADLERATTGFLHVCGGDPTSYTHDDKTITFSPRMWRWSSRPLSFGKPAIGFLHVCGGDPKTMSLSWFALLFSPRMWRWSWQNNHINRQWWVFSTYVEVILYRALSP